MDKNPRQITRLRMNDQYKIEYLMTYGDINTADDTIDLSNFDLIVNSVKTQAVTYDLEDVFTSGQEYEVSYVKDIIDGILFEGDVYLCEGYIVRPVVYQFDNIDNVVNVATLEGESTSMFGDEGAGFVFTKQANGKLLAEMREK